MLDTFRDCIMTAVMAVFGIGAAIIVLGLLTGVFAAILTGGITLGAILVLVAAVLLGAAGGMAAGSIILITGCFVLF